MLLPIGYASFNAAAIASAFVAIAPSSCTARTLASAAPTAVPGGTRIPGNDFSAVIVTCGRRIPVNCASSRLVEELLTPTRAR